MGGGRRELGVRRGTAPGRTETELCPQGETTRAEMAMILKRFLEKERPEAPAVPEEPPKEEQPKTPGTLFGGGSFVTFPPAIVTLTADKTSVPEGGSLTYTATLSRPVQVPVTVTLSNGLTITIPAGKPSGSVTFTPRESAASIIRRHAASLRSRPIIRSLSA